MKKLFTLVLVVSLLAPSLALAFQPLPLIQLVRGCTVPNSINYNPLANQDDGSCIPIIRGCMSDTAINYSEEANVATECYWGGRTFIDLIAKVQRDDNLWAEVHGRTIIISFLASKFTTGAVLVDTVSHPFALTAYGQPTINGWSIAYMGENYGYDYRVENTGVNTYHIFSFDVEEAGTYYIRPVIKNISESLGLEMVVEVL